MTQLPINIQVKNLRKKLGSNQIERKPEIDIIGNVPWGTHICHFYRTKEDLVEILVPYFKTGLENNEFCIWITSEPLKAGEAKAVLKKEFKNFDSCIKKGQIEILDYSDWYTKSGKFDIEAVLQSWVEKEKEALRKGFAGLRVSGNTFWLGKKDGEKFADYEAKVNSVIAKQRMIAACSYSLDKCQASELIDVVNNHQFAFIRKEGKWTSLESSERKKAKEAIWQSEERYRIQFETAIDAIFLADPETGMIIGCNIAAAKLVEREKREIIGKHQSFLHPAKDIIDGVSKTFKRHVAGEASELLEDRVITKSGLIKDVAIRASRIPFEGKEVLQGIFRDITERKKREEALRVSEQKFKDLVEATPDWIWEVDRDGIYTYVSPKVKEILGYEVSEVLGKTPFDFMPKEEVQRVGGIFKEKLMNKESFYRLENINRRNNGQLVVLETNGNPIFDENGRVSGYRGIDRDITGRKRREEALKKSQEKLREQKLALEQKNMALKEMLEHIERTKNKTKEDILINVNELILPIFKKLKIKGASPKYVDLLQYHIEDIVSSFGRKITEKPLKLTPREIEICNMLKGGFLTKDVSELLNLSPQTIEKHRKNIRKKLGISNRTINLISYLRRI